MYSDAKIVHDDTGRFGGAVPGSIGTFFGLTVAFFFFIVFLTAIGFFFTTALFFNGVFPFDAAFGVAAFLGFTFTASTGFLALVVVLAFVVDAAGIAQTWDEAIPRVAMFRVGRTYSLDGI